MRRQSPTEEVTTNDHQHAGIAGAVSEIIRHLTLTPEAEGLRRTPDRVARALLELTAGYGDDPAEILKTTFDGEDYDEIIIVEGIPFVSLCEHHLLAFEGTATIAYLPAHNRIVGLSKLPRLVECFARRLQVQERLTVQIADAIQSHLRPLGVGVIVRSKHSCMRVRGVQKDGVMTTSRMLGAFREDGKVKAEFLSLIGVSAGEF